MFLVPHKMKMSLWYHLELGTFFDFQRPPNFNFSQLKLGNILIFSPCLEWSKVSLLYQLEEQKLANDDAAQETLNNVKDVGKHHFGMRIVLVYDSHLQEDTQKMIL